MSALAGTGALLRLAWRKDRVRLSVWVGSVVLWTLYCVQAIKAAYPDVADLEGLLAFVQGPAGVAMTGPGYGLDNPTYATVFAGVYALYVNVAVAFLVSTLVIRHTRADEETGRAELIGASAVGRYAPLAATGGLAVAASLVVGAGVTAATWTYGSAADAVLTGASSAAVGLAFAGLAAIAAQVAERARAATGLAALAIGGALVIRGVGDVMREHGSWLSWWSPFAWSQQTRPFVDGRWWPLLLSLGVCVAGFGVAAVLLARRDLGAGLLAGRPGRSRATPSLAGPFGLAWRLDRGALWGWSLGVGLSGLLYGSLAASVNDSLADLPENLRTVLLAQDGDLADGYAATMVFFNALLVASYAVVAVNRLASEESEGRAEAVLATAVSRWRWMGSAVGVSLVGAAVVSAASGVGLGVAVSASLSDASRFWPLVGAQLAYLPAVAVCAAVAALLVGVRPSWVGAAWGLIAWAMIGGFFGQIIDLPSALTGLSPFEHVARAPVEQLAVAPLGGLGLVAVALVVVGMVAFRRRDVPA